MLLQVTWGSGCPHFRRPGIWKGAERREGLIRMGPWRGGMGKGIFKLLFHRYHKEPWLRILASPHGLLIKFSEDFIFL